MSRVPGFRRTGSKKPLWLVLECKKMFLEARTEAPVLYTPAAALYPRGWVGSLFGYKESYSIGKAHFFWDWGIQPPNYPPWDVPPYGNSP